MSNIHIKLGKRKPEADLKGVVGEGGCLNSSLGLNYFNFMEQFMKNQIKRRN